MKEIKFVDLNAEYLSLKDDIDTAIHRTIESGQMILGYELSQFEKEFANYLGVKYAVGVNSGSDGLYLALKAIGIGNGDEVITVSNTYVSTVDAIVRNGATPVFVDVDELSYNMSTDLIENRISNRTKAILPVHLFGQPAELRSIVEIARKYDITVVEDACQAHGSTYEGKKVGSIGDVGVFSFYPTKNLGAYGDGGIVVSNNETIYENLKILRNVGQSQKYKHDVLGINSRLDEIQAAILSVKLKKLDKWNEIRRSIASKYTDLLKETGYILPKLFSNRKHVFHLFVIRTKRRTKLMDILAKRKIPSLIHYPIPVHRQSYYANLSVNNDLPITDTLSNEILSLPLHPFLVEEQIEYIASVLNEEKLI